MSKVYIYKVVVDAGRAPCVRGGTLSLAICKPAIRSSAKPYNIILGFAGNSLYSDNCLVYAARITCHLDARDYFSRAEYANRPDCIYLWNNHRFEWNKKLGGHSSDDDLTHDLGEAPEYNRANVLLSEGDENFRYFGGHCPIDYKQKYFHVKSLVEGLGRGHRVNFEPELREELRRFLERIWHEPSYCRETSVPDVSCHDKCSTDDDAFVEVDC